MPWLRSSPSRHPTPLHEEGLPGITRGRVVRILQQHLGSAVPKSDDLGGVGTKGGVDLPCESEVSELDDAPLVDEEVGEFEVSER